MSLLDKVLGEKPKAFVLIIEDDPEPASILTEYLRLHNYRTHWVQDGLQGLDFIKKEVPDLVLLDIMMPKMDGFNVLLKIKAEPKTKNIPVVMCTALNGLNEVERCCNWGADGYITKPFELKRVLEKLSSVLDPKSGGAPGPQPA